MHLRSNRTPMCYLHAWWKTPLAGHRERPESSHCANDNFTGNPALPGWQAPLFQKWVRHPLKVRGIPAAWEEATEGKIGPRRD